MKFTPNMLFTPLIIAVLFTVSYFGVVVGYQLPPSTQRTRGRNHTWENYNSTGRIYTEEGVYWQNGSSILSEVGSGAAVGGGNTTNEIMQAVNDSVGSNISGGTTDDRYFLGNITCSSIVGADSDFCVDATGGSINLGNYMLKNESNGQTMAGALNLNATGGHPHIILNGSGTNISEIHFQNNGVETASIEVNASGAVVFSTGDDVERFIIKSTGEVVFTENVDMDGGDMTAVSNIRMKPVSPAGNVAGEIHFDSDDNTYRGYNGTDDVRLDIQAAGGGGSGNSFTLLRQQFAVHALNGTFSTLSLTQFVGANSRLVILNATHLGDGSETSFQARTVGADGFPCATSDGCGTQGFQTLGSNQRTSNMVQLWTDSSGNIELRAGGGIWQFNLMGYWDF